MKTKNILLLIALATATIFTGCQPEAPFDTQSPDDAPIILTPYNESGTGTFTYDLINPDTPLYDSVTVTPSAYTTINWYLNKQLVYTGTKIDMCFPAGTYALTIEAVTQAGLRTERTGTVTVKPYDYDPYSAAPAAGRHVVPGMDVTIDGKNLDKVTSVILTKDLFGSNPAATIEPKAKTDVALSFELPALEDGTYFLRLVDAEGKIYGADDVDVHNGAVALAGFAEMPAGNEWVITGVNLQDVSKVVVDGTEITNLQVTATSVTLTAPEAEVGEHTLSMINSDGSAVLFITAEGSLSEVTTMVSAETTLWTGPVTLDWNADLVKVDASTMAAVPVGATIFVYYNAIPADYYALRITTPWWGDVPEVDDLVPQKDMKDIPAPFTFTYDSRCQNLVKERGAMSLVGWGLEITKITFK